MNNKNKNLLGITWEYAPKSPAVNIRKKAVVNKKSINSYSISALNSTLKQTKRRRAKSGSNFLAKYKIIYTASFLCIFITLFFLSISISSASNLNTKKRGDIEFDVMREDNPDKYLESYVFFEDDENDKEESDPGQITQFVTGKVEYSKCRVVNNENLNSISKKFGLLKDTIILVNNLKNTNSVKSGMLLKIPNRDGRTIKVGKNDSIFKIANRYGVKWENIADANGIESSLIVEGDSLFIPGSKMTDYEKKRFYSEIYLWPLKSRKITSKYGPRIDPFTKAYSFHTGIDIKDDLNAKVLAVTSGEVSFVGKNKVYGNYIEIKYNDDIILLYAHLNKVDVKKGDFVNQGAVIGKVGSTGRSTGPHLHLEIRKDGKLVDPLKIML